VNNNKESNKEDPEAAGNSVSETQLELVKDVLTDEQRQERHREAVKVSLAKSSSKAARARHSRKAWAR
jgi:hypothetical protein